jgi:ribosome-associated protein
LAKEKKAPAKSTIKSTVKKTQKKPLEDPLNKLIIDTILNKKGQNINLLDLRNVSGPTDFFIICEADNITLTKAIADYISKEVKDQLGVYPNHIEGKEQAKWVLVDYFTTVVHIFHKEVRSFYELEHLWSDANSVEFNQL